MNDKPYWLNTCSYSEFTPSMGVPVRISLGTPKFPVPDFDPARWIRDLTPKGFYFRAEPSEYNRQFYGQLDRAGVSSIHEQLKQMELYEGSPLVLLCYEQLSDSAYREGEDVLDVEARICHRRMFAKWWRAQTGEEIPELGLRPRKIP